MEKQRMTRKRFCGALYVLATLVTAALLAVAFYRQGVAESSPYFYDKCYDIFAGFPPLFMAEYLLWRAAVYLFCTSERTVRRTALTVLYGLLGLGMLVFPFHASVKLNVKWWLVGAYVTLRGVEALVDITRAYVRIRSGREKRGMAEFFFILIALSVALFLIMLGVGVWDQFFSDDWLSGFLLVFVVLWAPPLLLAVGLLRKCVLSLSDGTDGRVFPFLYGIIAAGIFISGSQLFYIRSSLPWVLVCVYGAVQALDMLLADVRTPRGEGEKG